MNRMNSMNRMQEELHSYYRTLFEDTFGMVMRLSQWLCTAPYPLEPYQCSTLHNRTRIVVLKFVKILYSLLVFGAMITQGALMYFSSAKVVYVYAVPMTIKIMYHIHSVLKVLFLCYVIFVYQLRAGFHRYYFDRICHVLEQFGRRDIDLGLQKVRRTVRMLMLLSLPHIALSIVQSSLYAGNWSYLLKFVTFTIGNLIAWTVTWQYVTILGTVLILLRQMNDTLESLLVPAADAGAVSIRLAADDRRTVEKIRFLQLDLMRVVTKVNGGELGILLGMTIIASFFYVNTTLLQIYQGMRKDTIPLALILLQLFNIVLKFFVYIILAYPNRLIQKQTLRVRNVLHQLNKVENGTICSNVINRFITQTSVFCKAYEAFGIIPLDMCLIFKIFGGITSIFVVLIQFNDSFEKE